MGEEEVRASLRDAQSCAGGPVVQRLGPGEEDSATRD